MMKRKILAVVLPIVGCATVVGSGFSAWYFGEGGNAGSPISTGVLVTEEVKADSKNLSVDTSASTIVANVEPEEEGYFDGRLVLDQGGANNDSFDSGIMFGDSTDTVTTDTKGKKWAFKVSYIGDTDGEGSNLGLTLGELYDAGLMITIDISIEIKGNLVNYVEFQSTQQELSVTSDIKQNIEPVTLKPVTLTPSITKLTGKFDVPVDDITSTVRDLVSAYWSFEIGVDTEKKIVGESIDYSNSLLKYKVNNATTDEADYTGGKPLTSKQLSTMRGLLQNSGGTVNEISFSAVAKIVEDPNR